MDYSNYINNLELCTEKDIKNFLIDCFANKTLPYTYFMLQKMNKLNNIPFLNQIEKYCLGVREYNSILISEADNIINYFKEKNINLYPVKGYFINKYLYENNSIRELSDIDFICLDTFKKEIILEMPYLNYKTIRYNDKSNLDISIKNVTSVLFIKKKNITIKMDFKFVEDNSLFYFLIKRLDNEENKINKYSMLLYLILLSIDQEKNICSFNLMKQIDLHNFFIKNSKITYKEVDLLINKLNNPYKCKELLKKLNMEEKNSDT